MPLAAEILAVVYLESLAWTKPSTWRIFGLATQAEAELTKGLALNQGYYNLFLAIGVITGVMVTEAAPDGSVYAYDDDLPWWTSAFAWGTDVVTFGLTCMVAAAVVLLISSKGRMVRGAAIQGLAPLAALMVIAAA